MNNLYANQWVEETCPLCGTVFLPPDRSVWAYKGRFGKSNCKQYFCSYHCYQEAKRGSSKEKKRQQLGKLCKLTETDLDNMHSMMKNGASPTDCAKYFSVDLKTIHRYLDKRREQFRDVWDYMGYSFV